MAWKIEFADSALKQLKKLDKHTAKEIINYLEKKISVLDDPQMAGKPLKGMLAIFWRYRIGDYRVICHIDQDLITVLILRISHRKNVYDNEKKLKIKASSEINDFFI